jgi:hypothetical protein
VEGRFAQVRGLPDKRGYMNWPCLGRVHCHKINNKKKLLFVVVMEELSRMMTTIVDKGLLSSFSAGQRIMESW